MDDVIRDAFLGRGEEIAKFEAVGIVLTAITFFSYLSRNYSLQLALRSLKDFLSQNYTCAFSFRTYF